MNEAEKKQIEDLVKSQFEGDNVVVPSFTASQIAFIQKLIDSRLDIAMNKLIEAEKRRREI